MRCYGFSACIGGVRIGSSACHLWASALPAPIEIVFSTTVARRVPFTLPIALALSSFPLHFSGPSPLWSCIILSTTATLCATPTHALALVRTLSYSSCPFSGPYVVGSCVSNLRLSRLPAKNTLFHDGPMFKQGRRILPASILFWRTLALAYFPDIQRTFRCSHCPSSPLIRHKPDIWTRMQRPKFRFVAFGAHHLHIFWDKMDATSVVCMSAAKNVALALQ
eukprot:CAMPEP_0180625650 /NCGR_PEP_ID=MMETSP1037_2-20121125/37430_1 /TAXON_ID=632150 /ORGANISM="Azadinium spinosum, Strain 3D9" /LENGTH=221 /DNA_ID=CAMNT_0022646177 /DNA_START=85 /DNA_END=752 /DNA_ORIENTATION=+